MRKRKRVNRGVVINVCLEQALESTLKEKETLVIQNETLTSAHNELTVELQESEQQSTQIQVELDAVECTFTFVIQR